MLPTFPKLELLRILELWYVLVLDDLYMSTGEPVGFGPGSARAGSGTLSIHVQCLRSLHIRTYPSIVVRPSFF